MARVWVALPGGRLKRFKSPQVRHDCRKRRHGRPAVGTGFCYRRNLARAERRYLNAQLRAAGRAPAAFAELALLGAPPHYIG